MKEKKEEEEEDIEGKKEKRYFLTTRLLLVYKIYIRYTRRIKMYCLKEFMLDH
jgi:hypothetical protein